MLISVTDSISQQKPPFATLGSNAKRSLHEGKILVQVGIIDLLYDRVPDRGDRLYGAYFRKQFMGIMPQAIAVWCRELGHNVHYTTYWGQCDPIQLLPGDLDVLFVSAYTQSSALAYAIALLFRKAGTLTVIGGPHARSFPNDCVRFFDFAVQDCDRNLIDDLLRRRYDPPAILSSGRPLVAFPSVEDRMPEIRRSAFYGGKPRAASTVPLLSSTGCPYSCGFCVDWKTTYTALPADALAADLAYLSANYPGLLIAYHDPNFAIRFDQTMDIIERIPAGRRNRYVMESSLSVLKSDRLGRLTKTNCVYVAPGVESWTSYSEKGGTGASTGREKLEKVVAHLNLLGTFVPGIQANFMFGADSDCGDDPVLVTKDFIHRTPAIWPTINIPTPYGGTPLYDEMYEQGRILTEMPFMFYYNPYLAVTIKHYDPLTFYDKLIDLNMARASSAMLLRRLLSRTSNAIRAINVVRTLSTWNELRELREIRRLLATDHQFRLFHDGRSQILPTYYSMLFDRRMGRYAELLPADSRRPVLEIPSTAHEQTMHAPVAKA